MYKEFSLGQLQRFGLSDGTLILKFLRAAIAGFLMECQDSEHRRVMSMMLSMASVGVNFLDEMYRHGIWLDCKCGAVLYEIGTSFISGYRLLAAYALVNQQCLFAIKPEMHVYKHIRL